MEAGIPLTSLDVMCKCGQRMLYQTEFNDFHGRLVITVKCFTCHKYGWIRENKLYFRHHELGVSDDRSPVGS